MYRFDMVMKKIVATFDITPAKPFVAPSSDLVIVNTQAVDKGHPNDINNKSDHNNNLKNLANRSKPPLPSIRVWESVDEPVIDKKSIQLTSVTAWEENGESETVGKEESENSFVTLVNKVTLMSHELKPFLVHDHDPDTHSDVELEDVFPEKSKARSTSAKRLLRPRDVDAASLSSLEDEEDKPNFSSSQLIVADLSPEITTVEKDSSFDVIEGDDVVSNPHNAWETSTDLCTESEKTINVVRNPSFSDGESFKNRDSRRSRLSSNGSNSNKSNCSISEKQEEYEMEERNTNNKLTEDEKAVEEDTGLLNEPYDRSSTSQGEDNMDDNASETSDSSEFLGSLGIYAPPGTWESNLRVNLDLQLGREEWETSITAIEGEASLDGWSTSISEINKSNARPEDWCTSLQEISDSLALKSDWSCSITEGLEKKDLPADWKTRFNKIEKLQEDRKEWRTIFRKIKERVYDNNEWKFKCNRISNRKKADNKNEWKSNLTSSFRSNNDKNADWGFKFNKLGTVTLSGDVWSLRDRKMLVTSDDRKTHWNTKFLAIQNNGEESRRNTWSTEMRKIEPIPEDRTWETEIKKMSDDLGSPTDWQTKFIGIQSNENNPKEWALEMNDVPDSTKDEKDWTTKFQQIEELSDPNESWDTSFNDISEKNENGTEIWENTFNEPEIKYDEDIWEMKFNRVLLEGDRDTDWEVTLNPIEFEGEIEDE